jgi:hypothetical protein
MDLSSPENQAMERHMVLHGGTSPIQGKTYESYKSLQPGSIPTRLEIVRKFPVVKQFDQFAGGLSDFIFNNQMRKFKVMNYALRRASWLARNPDAGAAETTAAMRSIAAELNAVYGGLHWENLGVNRMTQEMARFLLLAPDWTFSNVFNVKMTFENSEGGNMARAFWIRSALGGIAFTQAYSLLMTQDAALVVKKFKERPFYALTHAYLGRDAQGRDIWQNVGFRGATSDTINLISNVALYGPFEGPARSLVGKAAPGFRTLFELYMNEDFLHHKIVDPNFTWTANAIRSGEHVAKGVLPIPFSVTNLYDMLKGKPEERATAKEIIGTVLFGQAPRHAAPAGTHSSKGILRPNRVRPEKSLWQQISQ